MKLTIDEKQFALALMQKEKPAGLSNEKFIKENLLLYLEAVIAINQFNSLEEKQFQQMKENDIREIITEILGARLNS